MLITVPTLDELLEHPDRIQGLSPKELAALVAKCSTLQGILLAELLVSGLDRQSRNDRLLSIEEAARILAVPTDWLYRHGKRLGLAVKIGDGTLRFSNAAIQKAIAENRISPIPPRRRKSRSQIVTNRLTGELS